MDTKTHPIDLTDEQMSQIEQFAQENDMTPEQAASALASMALRDRYATPRTAGVVLPFKRG